MIYLVTDDKNITFFDQHYYLRFPTSDLNLQIVKFLYGVIKKPFIVQTYPPIANPSVVFKYHIKKFKKDFFHDWFYIEPVTQSGDDEIHHWWKCYQDTHFEISQFYVCDKHLDNRYDNTIYFDSFLCYEYNKLLECPFDNKTMLNDISHKIVSFNLKPKHHRKEIVEYINSNAKKDAVCTIGKRTLKNIFPYYKKGVVALVNETNFYTKYPNYSEKTIDCFVSTTPFVLTAPPGTLKLLRDHGFKTFGKYWDESYDEVVDHEQRLEKIKKNIDTIVALDYAELKKILVDMQDILMYNYEHAHKIGNNFKKTLKGLV